MTYLSSAEISKVKQSLSKTEQKVRQVGEEGDPVKITRLLESIFKRLEEMGPEFNLAAYEARVNPGDKQKQKEFEKIQLRFNLYRDLETLLEDALTVVERRARDSVNNLKELTDFLDKYGKWDYYVGGGRVIYEGDLSIKYDRPEPLPESFGNLEVTGQLDLANNRLTSLPESFGNLKLNGDLDLSINQLTSLPESFGNLKISGNLDLSGNQLTSLPESFANLEISGSLYLNNNQLTSLPESFGNLKIGRSLSIDYNQLTSLPESFGNLEVARTLDLSHNQLTSLPENFGNLKATQFWMIDNPFKTFPKSIINIPLRKTIIGDKYKKQIQNMREWYEDEN